MSNLGEMSSSGERLSFYKLFSEKNFDVEIPKIQRDYAQGRGDEKDVRDSFLNALFQYLAENRPNRDLDFVYGTVVEQNGCKNFIPLDGQQRLTTLFLLHWYLGQISGQSEHLRSVICKDGKSRFRYETRSSSERFCNALMTNNIDMVNLLETADSKPSLSITIKDKGWFYLSWNSDPTIQSMLTMLDAIHAKFSGQADFFNRLTNDEPVITFLFLNLQEFNLTDDLYIKMNARGKPLTDFENFKARLEKKIKSFEGEWPQYQLSFNDQPVGGYEYFIHKIDTAWADTFWGYRDESTRDDTFDDEMMNFIALILANFHILRADVEVIKLGDVRSRLFGSGGKLNKLSFFDYEDLEVISQKAIVYLIKMLDMLQSNQSESGKIRSYLANCKYYSEEDYFKKVISNNTSYPEKIRFHAFYTYLANGKGCEELQEWMRVVYNLTENTIIDSVDDYHKALKAIHDLTLEDDSVLNLLRRDYEFIGFTEVQIFEEKVKAHLILRSQEWKQLVIKAEDHPFFRGQIGFLLKFAGVVDYYIENKNTNWDDKNSQFLEKLNKYYDAAAAVFNLVEQGSDKVNFIWERAVLTKGEYFTSASADRFNLLSTRSTGNNIERDHSWRRLLRLPSKDEKKKWESRQEFVKAVFDDPNFNGNDVVSGLKVICENALKELSKDDWRTMLVKHPDLFKVCKQGFIVKNDDEIVLLHQSQRNHYHSEIFSKFLELELQTSQIDIKPFQSLRYIDSKNRDSRTYVELRGYEYLSNSYSIIIWYESNEYRVCFKGHNISQYPVELCKQLADAGFIFITDKQFQGIYQFGCMSYMQVEDKLGDVCKLLSDLI
jgi:hypothetical protein